MLILVDDASQVLLERRPPAGIWGGLWSLPECPEGESSTDWIRQRLGLSAELVEIRPVRRHTFSHFRLDMIPVHLRVTAGGAGVAEGPDVIWYSLSAPQSLGLAAPVAALIREVSAH
jgi:A/G-specific adenine glycosylase